MFRSFVIKLCAITAGLALAILITNYFSDFFHSFRWFSWIALLFFFLLTLITGVIGFRSIAKSPHGFVAGVNGIVLIKLLFCVGLVITYMLISRPTHAGFITSFFIFYVVYTVFEVSEIISAQKKTAVKK